MVYKRIWKNLIIKNKIMGFFREASGGWSAIQEAEANGHRTTRGHTGTAGTFAGRFYCPFDQNYSNGDGKNNNND
jgi:hypothetical protein